MLLGGGVEHVDHYRVQRRRRLVSEHDRRRARPSAVGEGCPPLPATRGLNGSNTGQVRCSVVVAARDEEARLEETVRHLLAQHGVAVDVIAVDDRSTDRTGEILRRLAGLSAARP